VTGRDWALLVHLLGVVALFSGMSIAWVAHSSARRRERPSEIALLLGLSRFGVAFVGAGALLVLIGGFWLIEESNGFYSLGDGWIAAGLLLLLGAFVVGGLGGQQPKRARQLAEELAREGDASTEELRKLLDDPLATWLNYAAAAAIFVAFMLMIWKP
jgi:uncharacterized membrane protein